MKYFISIGKNVESFEHYKKLWNEMGVDGFRADTITEGIAKAITMERSLPGGLYFIEIVADDIEFMPQLKILSEGTNAPILIATSNPNTDECKEVLSNGADYYRKFCKTEKQNIETIIAAISSIERRAVKTNISNQIITHKDILISKDFHLAFISDKEIKLTKMEMEILYYLILNRGLILTHTQIRQRVWPDDEEANSNNIYNNVKRLRDKMRSVSGKEHIENVVGIGYRLT